MTFIVADRVQETATSPGTGTVTLLGASTGYRAFSAAVGANNTTYYVIADQSGANWEVGLGTVGSGGTTLARTTVLSSSNGGSLTNFSSGSQYVWADYTALKAMLLDASGKVNAGGNGYLDFASVAPTVAAGRQWYDDTTGSWNLGMGGGNITQQIGEELFIYGKASAAITNSPLQIIKQTAPVGSSGVIGFAPTTSGIADGNLIIGIATESLALNGFGRITCFGTVHGITTDGSAYGETWADGDVIWYNPTTGNPTKVKPVAPNIKVQVGTIISAGSGGSGSFAVEINHGSVLGGTDSNVQLTSAADLNLLQFYGAGGYWRNVTPQVALGAVPLTFTAKEIFQGSTSAEAMLVTNIAEAANIISAAPSATTNFYVSSGAVQWYTSSMTANIILNFAFSSGTSLNTAMAIGDSISLTLLTNTGSTPYTISSFAIDGSAVTPYWQGGIPGIVGNGSSLDVYNFVIIKIGSASYRVMASATFFK